MFRSPTGRLAVRVLNVAQTWRSPSPLSIDLRSRAEKRERREAGSVVAPPSERTYARQTEIGDTPATA